MVSGIYSILNKKNGKIYVGQSINIRQRFYDHKKHLRKDIHNNKHLQSAWNKYGEDSFEFNVLEPCEPSMLNSNEVWWIEYFDSTNREKGYNHTIGGDFCPTKCPEIAKKISNSLKGRTFSDEHRKNLSKAHKGKKLSDEHRANMSKAQKNRKHRPHKLSSKIKMSEARNTRGFYNVSKQKEPTCKQGFIWRYLYQENGKTKKLASVNLDKLKEKVLAKGLEWREINGFSNSVY